MPTAFLLESSPVDSTSRFPLPFHLAFFHIYECLSDCVCRLFFLARTSQACFDPLGISSYLVPSLLFVPCKRHFSRTDCAKVLLKLLGDSGWLKCSALVYILPYISMSLTLHTFVPSKQPWFSGPSLALV